MLACLFRRYLPMLFLLGGILLPVAAFASFPHDRAQDTTAFAAQDVHACCKVAGASAGDQSGCHDLKHCGGCLCGLAVTATLYPTGAAPMRPVLYPLISMGRSEVVAPVPQRPPIVFQH
jgi:hypothetical protein